MSAKKELGTIVEVKGEYFLQTSGLSAPGKKDLVLVGSTAEKESFAGLVGKEVEVVLSEPVRSVIAIVGKSTPTAKLVKILCYKPRDDIIGALVDQRAVESLASQFLKEGILSQANYNKIVNADASKE
jgi:hypothetical protein